MFENENQTTTTTNEPINEEEVKTGGHKPETDVDKFIKDVDDLKKNTVSKEEYEKIVAENDKLRKAYIEKNPISTGEEKQVEPTKEEIQKEYEEACIDMLNTNPRSNLDIAKASLRHRDASIAAGKGDPYLPRGSKIQVTDDDIAKADNLAKVMKECIEESDGDEGVFTAKINSKLIEPPLRKPKNR